MGPTGRGPYAGAYGLGPCPLGHVTRNRSAGRNRRLTTGTARRGPPTYSESVRTMTDAEFEKVQREIRERNERTTFGPADPRDQYEAHGHHAEYGAGAH
jgi:hypothetical protein